MTIEDRAVSHSDLVVVAREWLRKSRRCSVVVSEISCAAAESPDAIGWHSHETHLVECKTSRSDFLADRKKFVRQFAAIGMGDYRWYLTLPEVVKGEHELLSGWGWIVADGGQVRVMRKADRQPEKRMLYETSILLSVLKRIGQNPPDGCSITCYTHETKNRTVLEIDSQLEEADAEQ